MAIDYSALLGLSAGIQVAKATIDVARDGGADRVARGVPDLPSGSIILALASSPSRLYLSLGATLPFVNGLNVGLPARRSAARSSGYPAPTLAIVTRLTRRAIQIRGYDCACLTGVAQLWLFYLPT